VFQPLSFANGQLNVPARPAIPYLSGDGIGPEVWAATRQVVDAAVRAAYPQQREIGWIETLAGQRAYDETGTWLPEDTLTTLATHLVAIKGPLTTPVAGGIRSLNVQLRRDLDLYANVRPVRWFLGLPSPLRHPELVNAVIFRENTEDVYAGYEVPAHSPEAATLRRLLRTACGWELTDDTGIGLKPISEHASKRLVRAALRYAIDRGRRRVTLVHKGNIMKYTEGAFRDWGYQVVRNEFADRATIADTYDHDADDNRILVQDRIADAMFQDILLHPDHHQVIATTNLNGDYLSDALAAQIGGIGVSPGANLNDEQGRALYEAVHGTAPDITGRDLANPTALMFSAEMLLRRIGWTEAADHIETAIETTIASGTVTADLAARVPGTRPIGTRQYTEAVLAHIG
jgi:isocitrate dehydrogenase